MLSLFRYENENFLKNESFLEMKENRLFHHPYLFHMVF
jgi:hypothetical protein